MEFQHLNDDEFKNLLATLIRVGKERYGIVVVESAENQPPQEVRHEMVSDSAINPEGTDMKDKVSEQHGFKKPKKTCSKKRRREMAADSPKLVINNSFEKLDVEMSTEEREETKNPIKTMEQNKTKRITL